MLPLTVLMNLFQAECEIDQLPGLEVVVGDQRPGLETEGDDQRPGLEFEEVYQSDV